MHDPYGDRLSGISLAQAEADGDGGTDIGNLNRVLRLIRMAKLVKLARMFRLIRYMQVFEEFFTPALVSVTKLVMTMILVSHWFGCLWWIISDLERDPSLGLNQGGYESQSGEYDANQWVAPLWLVESPHFSEKYSLSFLWGAGMVTAMVPFDVVPVTAMESWVTITTMYIGLVLNAIVISSLTTALSTMNAKKQVASKQLDTIRSYMVLKSVPNDVRSRVLEYYEYFYTSSQSLANSIKYSEMPPNLAAQLALSINRKLAARCTFFRDVGNASIVRLISELSPAIFVPGQLIVFEGHPLMAVYFINRGLVQLLQRMRPIGALRDNENFGLDDYAVSLDEGKEPMNSCTAKAVGYCDVMTLAIEKLAEVANSDGLFRSRHQVGAGSFSAGKAKGTIGGKMARAGRRCTAMCRLGGKSAAGRSKSRDLEERSSSPGAMPGESTPKRHSTGELLGKDNEMMYMA